MAIIRDPHVGDVVSGCQGWVLVLGTFVLVETERETPWGHLPPTFQEGLGPALLLWLGMRWRTRTPLHGEPWEDAPGWHIGSCPAAPGAFRL